MHVQGNCIQPPPSLAESGLSGAALQWAPPQCIIVVDPSIIALQGNLWLDALYIRPPPVGSEDYHSPPMLSLSGSAQVYATRLMLQGDGSRRFTALYSSGGSRLYMQGMHLQMTPNALPAVACLKRYKHLARDGLRLTPWEGPCHAMHTYEPVACAVQEARSTACMSPRTVTGWSKCGNHPPSLRTSLSPT